MDMHASTTAGIELLPTLLRTKQSSCVETLDEASDATGKPVKSDSAEGVFGFRASMTVAGFLPATVLTMFVPLVALYQGHVKLPHVLISDVMASHKLYGAFYSWGLSISMSSCCFVLREASSYWYRTMPVLAEDLNRFMLLLYSIVAPGVFGLVSFQYSSDLEFNLSGETTLKSLLDLNIFFWFMHVACTSATFLGGCAMACIFVRRISPALVSSGLVNSRDQYVRKVAANTVVTLTPVTMVVRLLHFCLQTPTWGIVFVILEITLIQLLITAALVGFIGLMKELDSLEPLVDSHTYWWTNTRTHRAERVR